MRLNALRHALGKGSDWENATWFEYPKHEALPVFEWLHHKYRGPKPGERG